ncbi:hypothetical protein [Paenibacillus endoradicis]|uniref:hypothetical protein n=1 Tax=Paenibacillus endoradicis TaxID=2972487 RepID=UPI002158FB14|nr:hypothetical protein [Paenibacillus endoradicis]MCR8657261.1 hypothetical protein [Paenibacillus endoradicis]
MENRVKFKIGDIEFEAEGSAEVVERERSVFLNALLPAAVDAIVRTRGEIPEKRYIENEEYQELLLPPVIDHGTHVIDVDKEDLSRTSLPSFIRNFGRLNDQDFALIAAYFDEKKNGTSMFSSENIKRYYAEARKIEYSNISELLRQLAKKGMIMDAPNPETKSPKQYVLTSEGILYVELYVPKGESQDRKTKSRPKKTRSRAESIFANLSADDMSLNKYPVIKKLNSFKEQMLLTMYIIVNEGKGDTFTVLDIQYLMTDILGLPASIDQINGIFQKNKSWFKSEQDTNNKKAVRRKLLEGAKDFAKKIIGEDMSSDN